MLIDLLIPTYNRADCLMENLRQLIAQIAADGLASQVRILISDNASSDDTQQQVADFLQQKSQEIEVCYFRNQENIGLERNAVAIFSKATSEYVLWLGDDDYLPEGYLQYCVEKILSVHGLGCIIPGLGSLYKDGAFIPSRLMPFSEKQYAGGYTTIYEIGHWSHQMSGILLRRAQLLEEYLQLPAFRNVYLFMFFAMRSMVDAPAVFAPTYKVRVSVDNAKAWGYDNCGLLSEVYKSYAYLKAYLPEEQVEALMYDFTRRQTLRFGIDPQRPITSMRSFLRYLGDIPHLSQAGKRKIRWLYMKDLYNRCKTDWTEGIFR